MKVIQNLRASQRGFTLIELVMVIVVLGILAAVALPKFVDLSNEASTATVKSFAGAISSASAANLAAKKLGNPSALTISGDAVCTKQVLGPLLQGGLPDSYSAMPTTHGVDASDNSGNCNIADTARCTIYDAKCDKFSHAIVSCAS